MSATWDGHYIIRERIRDDSEAYCQGFRASRVGTRAVSKTFGSHAAAEREASAWESTGDWLAIVHAGRAPNIKCKICKRSHLSNVAQHYWHEHPHLMGMVRDGVQL